MKQRLAWVAAAAAATLLMSACSKDDSGGPESGGSGSEVANSAAADNPELAGALKRVDEATKEPTEVGVTEPLSKRPAAGKTVAYMSCGVGVCAQIGAELDKAAKVLGWKINAIDSGTTPETVVAAWGRALASNPDAILTSGNPVVVYQSQLNQARQRGIPVVDWASANKPNTPGIIADINPVTDNQERGKLLADYAATQSGGKAKALFVNVPDYPTLLAGQKAFNTEFATVCPDCSNDKLDFAATDIGAKVPSAVVSYLQKNPDTNWIVLGFDDMNTGLVEALRAANLGDKVKIIGQSGNKTTSQNIKNGAGQVASIPQGVGQMAYKALDVLARHFNGDSLAADKANLLPIWIQTKATIGDPNDIWKGPKGYADTFAKLWKVSS